MKIFLQQCNQRHLSTATATVLGINLLGSNCQRRTVHAGTKTTASHLTKKIQRCAKSTTASNKSFLATYEKFLDKDPVKTKMVTGGFLWGLGDAVAQLVPQMAATGDSHSTNQKEKYNYDLMRTGRAVFFGFALHAPLSHLHFNFLESLTVKLKITSYKIPVFKAFMEQFVYWSWFSNSLYHGAMGAMQGMDLKAIENRIQDVLWDTQKAQWVFWIPVQLLNFQFVPVRHQLNVVLVTSVVWTALLSFWYPPPSIDETHNVNNGINNGDRDIVDDEGRKDDKNYR